MSKLLKKRTKEWMEHALTVAGMHEEAGIAEEVKEAFEIANQGDRLAIAISLSGVCITIHKLKKVEEVAPLLRMLAKRGWHHKGEPEKLTYGTPGMNWSLGDKLQVTGYFSEEAKCRLVKTGTKEVDVIELICDEDDK